MKCYWRVVNNDNAVLVRTLAILAAMLRFGQSKVKSLEWKQWLSSQYMNNIISNNVYKSEMDIQVIDDSNTYIISINNGNDTSSTIMQDKHITEQYTSI